MSGPGYPGQGNPQQHGGQSWGGQPTPGYPPVGPQGQGQWQNNQGSAPNWNGGAPGAPGGWQRGPGGLPPQGQHPGGGKRGPGAGIIIAISVLALALIGVLVWILFFKDDDATTAEPKPGTSSSSVETPSETDAPGDEDTPGGDEPGGDEPGGEQPGGDEPGGEQPGGQLPGGQQPGGQPGGQQPGGQLPGGQQPGGQLPGGQQPGGGGGLTAADLPKQIGDWQLSEFGLMLYNKNKDAANGIIVLDFGADAKEVMDFARKGMKNVDEFEGGFCGNVDNSAQSLEACYIHPGKKPNTVASVSGAQAKRAELLEVAKAIAAYK